MVLPEEETESLNNSSLKIDDVKIEDIPGIMAIQLSRIRKPEELQPHDAKQGFLVYEVGADELKTIIIGDIKHIIKVARKNGIVIGYFIAYDMNYYLQ